MLNDFTLRGIHSGDTHFLWKMLYEAVYWDPEKRRPPLASIVENELLARYADRWSRDGDMGIIVEDPEHQDRLGYGFVNEATSELALAVTEEWRNHGVGTVMIGALIHWAKVNGIPAISLSVHPDNSAINPYYHIGFEPLVSTKHAITMRRTLRSAHL